jgi:hypothetical protein
MAARNGYAGHFTERQASAGPLGSKRGGEMAMQNALRRLPDARAAVADAACGGP